MGNVTACSSRRKGMIVFLNNIFQVLFFYYMYGETEAQTLWDPIPPLPTSQGLM